MDEKRDYLLRWVANHYTMLGAYAGAILRNREAVNDVLGELTVTLARKADTVDVDRPLGPYARGILRNLCLRTFSKSSKTVAVDPSILDVAGAELDELDEPALLEQRKKALAKCMERLTRSARDLLEMRYFDALPYNSIAARLKKSVDSLHAMIYRSHKALAECIAHHVSVREGNG